MPEGWSDWLDRNITYVGESDSTVTGFFMLEPDGCLNMAFVLPAYRRSGLAHQLYAAILAEARLRDMPRMVVWASRLAMPFFRRQGWEDDASPPPREPHPIPSTDAQPIEWALKIELTSP